MKRLKRISLINWHRFTRHSFDVDGHLLLMGDNGSGKSTILDALQVGLVGNMRSVRLNLAANEGGDRSLKSYVLGLVGGANNGHTARTLRKNATSYILLEFADSGTGESVILGTVIDAHADGRPPDKEHFIAENLPMDEVPCLSEKNVPRRVREFKREIAGRKDIKRYARVEDYQTQVLKALGGLDPEFFRLFVSGMAFRKIRHLRDFVYDFLLPEAAEVQVASLRDAAERYRQLHELSEEARERIDLLDRIVANAQSAEAGQKECGRLRALIDRAGLAMSETSRESAIENHLRAKQELDEATSEHTAGEAENQSARDRLTRLQQDLAAHEQHSEALAIENRVERLADQIRHENRDSERLQSALKAARAAVSAWQKLLDRSQAGANSKDVSCSREEFVESFGPALGTRLEAFDELAADCLDGEIPPAGRQGFVRQVAEDWPAVSHWLQSRQFQIEALLAESQTQFETLQEQSRELSEGHRLLPPALTRLKQQLTAAGLTPLALCEAIEITRPDRQETIEAVLGAKRFDILVPPEQFASADRLFHGFDDPEASEFGLVNTPRLLEAIVSPAEGSLAQAIDSTNPLAKRYADVILGRVFADERESTATAAFVTDDGFLVRDFSIRRLKPIGDHQSWQIGGAEPDRQEALQRSLRDIQARIKELTTLFDHIHKVHELFDRGRRGPELLAEDYDLPGRLHDLRKDYFAAREEAAALKESDLGELRQRVEEAEEAEHLAAKNLKHAWGRQCVAEESLKNADASLKQAEEQFDKQKTAYEANWPAESELRSQCEQIIADMPVGVSWEEQIRGWSEELESLQKSFAQGHDDGVRLRTEYNNRFQFQGDPLSEDIHEYASERERWTESELPGFGSRLESARETARQVLEEDVIHRLRERLDQVERHFRELNQALKGLNFSGRRYRFTHSVRREFQTFYDMIVSSDEVALEPLFNSAWHARYSEGPLKDLLEDVLGGGGNRALSNLERATDYRAYFDYDIEITESDGSVHAFSHVAGSGSGGETQTPYYVAMLASLARLYRPRAGRQSRAALVAFDEPFQKMDESNIHATLELARRLGLQVLLAAPKDRCHQLLPAIGTATCLLVLRDREQILLEPFQRIAEDGSEAEIPLASDTHSRLILPTKPKTVK